VSKVTDSVVKVGDLDIGYDVRGTGAPLLLVAGFGMTRAMWDEELCDRFAERGFTVVRMDNRDTGASTRLKELGVPKVPRLFVRSMLGARVTPPYTLEDMANDAFGLMKRLGYERFHVVGASMGGMIGQTMALLQPERLLSLTSIMSTPGGRRYSFGKLSALGGILKPMPRDEAAQVEHFFALFRLIGGTGMPFDEARGRKLAETMAKSKPSPAGSARQFAAILDSSSRRRKRLPTIKTPTLIMHGTHDPLLPVRGSKAMARMIPGAELVVVEGMGHSIPASKYDFFADAIARHAGLGAKAA
jgi:pimeloyl-ACP methyl ester carboxylesterase